MLSRSTRIIAAILSGITSSLLIAVTTAQAARDRPVVVYAEPENTRTERVSYADLDLSQRKDERKLNSRVAGAVKRVCLFEHFRSGLQNQGYYHCADGAWDGARPQIAQAVTRAKEVALTGRSSIAATAITISIPA